MSQSAVRTWYDSHLRRARRYVAAYWARKVRRDLHDNAAARHMIARAFDIDEHAPTLGAALILLNEKEER